MGKPANGTNNIHALCAHDATNILARANIASVTKNGNGDYTVVLTQGIDATVAVFMAGLNGTLTATTAVTCVQTDDETFEVLSDADKAWSLAVFNTLQT